jgi:predicted RND superfamily exporter protein
MLKQTIARTVIFCMQHARLVVLAAMIVAIASSVYAVRNFAITTDVSKLVSGANSPARQNQRAYEAIFPGHKIFVVVEAPTPELTDQAADRLAKALPARSDVLHSVSQPGGGAFFQRNGLLFLSAQEAARITEKLTNARPLLALLASDPNLRGIADALSLAATGVRQELVKLDDLARPLTLGANTLDDVLAGRPANFSWRVLAEGRPAKPDELRRLIEVEPILNYAALQPGQAAIAAVRQTAAEQKLASDFDARVRLTGQVAIDDEQFAAMRKSTLAKLAGTIVAVMIVLWLALRSWRIILAVALSLLVGLCLTAALGLLTVGTLNVISIAFAVLFIGLGVDFGLQFSVRYRSERHDINELHAAMLSAARKAGVPLALAAAATAAAFFCQ